MSKRASELNELIKEEHSNLLRDALALPRVNIMSLAKNFGILPSNTYFRKWIKNGKQHLGLSGFTNILNKMGYKFYLVPVYTEDKVKVKEIEEMIENAYIELSEGLKFEASGFVKAEPKPKAEPKVIENAGLISDLLLGTGMGIGEPEPENIKLDIDNLDQF